MTEHIISPEDKSNEHDKQGQMSGESEEKQKNRTEEQETLLTEEQLLTLKEELCADCPEKKAAQEEILRIKADADNFRKRVTREKEQFCKFATEGVLEDLLPVLDNLDLALQHGQGVEGCADLIRGIEMTRKVFLDSLGKHGLELICVQEGDLFDPAWHEAMAEQVREDLPPGSVTQVLQCGYKLRDRLLRPAKVMVNKK